MWSEVIVGLLPTVGEQLRVFDGLKELHVEQLITHDGVAAFLFAVLPR